MEISVTINSSTETLLDQWGKWSASLGLGLNIGTPSEDNFHVIHDELALIVDAVVIRMGKAKSSDHRQIVELRYRSNYSYHMIAHYMRCGETKVKNNLNESLSWIDGHLDSYRMELDKAA